MNNDFETVLEESIALAKKLNLTQLPGINWFKKMLRMKLDKTLDGLKSRPDIQDAIGDVISEVKKWAKNSDIYTKKQTEKRLHEVTVNDVARSIGMFEGIKPLKRKYRIELFGSETTPFSSNPEGFDQAQIWITDNNEKQKQLLETHSVTLQVHLWLKEWTLIETRWKPGESSKDMTQDRKREIFQPVLEEALKSDHISFASIVPDQVAATLSLSFGLYKVFSFWSGTLFATMMDEINVKAAIDNWFTSEEILRFIFFDIDLPIKRTIATSYEQSVPFVDTNQPNAILLRIRGSVREQEVLLTYRKALMERKLKVKKRLSYQSEQLLNFVYATPNKTWDERCIEWNKKCKSDKRLKSFKSRGGICQAFSRAIKQTSWYQ